MGRAAQLALCDGGGGGEGVAGPLDILACSPGIEAWASGVDFCFMYLSYFFLSLIYEVNGVWE